MLILNNILILRNAHQYIYIIFYLVFDKDNIFKLNLQIISVLFCFFYKL